MYWSLALCCPHEGAMVQLMGLLTISVLLMWCIDSSPSSRHVFHACRALILPPDGAKNSRYLYVTIASLLTGRPSVNTTMQMRPTSPEAITLQCVVQLLCSIAVLFNNDSASAGLVHNCFWFSVIVGRNAVSHFSPSPSPPFCMSVSIA